MIKTKSVHSPIEREDGLRILAARLRGRGLPASRYDVWMANLGPSEALLRDFLAQRASWAEFGRRDEYGHDGGGMHGGAVGRGHSIVCYR